MKVGIIQSCFVPWRGYFDFIDDVDLFIYHDDLQYTKNDWRNRNKIKTQNGLEWITVPVNYKTVSQLICETKIDYSQKWQKKMKNKIVAAYSKAPYFKKYADAFFELLFEHYENISELNVNINKWILTILNIKTKINMSREFSPVGSKTDRLIDILKKVGATVYLSGPSAKNYLEEEKFKSAGIDLEYKAYEYKEYPQLYGKFEPNVTVLDLLFNCGDNSRDFLKSLKPNERVV